MSTRSSSLVVFPGSAPATSLKIAASEIIESSIPADMTIAQYRRARMRPRPSRARRLSSTIGLGAAA